jgi:hypothetical protein
VREHQQNFSPCRPSFHPHNALPATRLLLLAFLRTLRLRRTPKLLRSVLSLLPLLPARPFHLLCQPVPHQSVVRLEFLQRLLGLVDECEAGALATTKVSAEAED